MPKRSEPSDLHNRPLAAAGLNSYRAKGAYGWIMIGAKDDDDALVQAKRSHAKVTPADIEKWDGSSYKPFPKRLDQWASVAMSPTGIPFELKPSGIVFRGMSRFEDARKYADSVAEFFKENNVQKTVFVVKGPTSTTRSAYEVVDASAGYPVVYQAICQTERPEDWVVEIQDRKPCSWNSRAELISFTFSHKSSPSESLVDVPMDAGIDISGLQHWLANVDQASNPQEKKDRESLVAGAIFTRKNADFKVRIESVSGDAVSYAPKGGGFLNILNRSNFLANFTLDAELEKYTSGAFGGDWMEDLFVTGYSIKSERWNGWSMPSFPKDSADIVAAMLTGVVYNEKEDCYETTDDSEIVKYPAVEIHVDGFGPIKTYAIGSGSWCWDAYKPEELQGMKEVTMEIISLRKHEEESSSFVAVNAQR